MSPPEEARERVRTEKLAQLGALLAGFAHEVRNPLSTIGLNLQLVMEEFRHAEAPRDKRTFKRLSVVEAEVKRLQAILEDFLGFARMPELELVLEDLNARLRSLADFTAPEMAEQGVTLRFYPGAGVGMVPLDWNHLRAALVNLLRNAQEACPDGGEVVLSTGLDGDSVLVRVMDSGEGMTPEVMEKAFTPYFSTKKRGTGLGLATTRRIVEEHGGSLSLSSEVGKGTQFTIRLRRQADEAGGGPGREGAEDS